eukprot:CAMPEP_0115355126 /NCGR_PEP_ID=MMETSP0270-20121206/98943_1 /TAXON_ID=71861 /ORGANISM="Scrippsiella trochoidea, Strain CCMP3099" /LENGTH=126 /DNA_ID=CAMNT_0002777485 /DNA_START=82 /DNA_END=463 /DNA_ORIENTATION=-
MWQVLWTEARWLDMQASLQDAPLAKRAIGKNCNLRQLLLPKRLGQVRASSATMQHNASRALSPKKQWNWGGVTQIGQATGERRTHRKLGGLAPKLWCIGTDTKPCAKASGLNGVGCVDSLQMLYPS